MPQEGVCDPFCHAGVLQSGKTQFSAGVDTRTRSVFCVKAGQAAREESDVLSENGSGICSMCPAPCHTVGHFLSEFAICRGRDSYFAV